MRPMGTHSGDCLSLVGGKNGRDYPPIKAGGRTPLADRRGPTLAWERRPRPDCGKRQNGWEEFLDEVGGLHGSEAVLPSLPQEDYLQGKGGPMAAGVRRLSQKGGSLSQERLDCAKGM